MTFSQKIIYDSIVKYFKENDKAPSIRDIGKLAGLSSSATMYRHLKNLKAKGYINYEPKKKRSIVII